MVAFVDLLGYSARVKSVTTLSDLKAIERDVRRVQNWLDHRSADTLVRDVQKLQAKKVLAFSDCLVIMVPSTSELAFYEGEYDVLMSEVVSLAYAQGRCAANGIFLRGGVDHGFWYKRRDTIVSPAMIEAYDLERCKAVVPIIAVSDRMIALLREHPQREYYSADSDPFPRYFKEVSLPDGRRQWMVDYLPLFLGEIDGAILPEDRERYIGESTAVRETMRGEAYERDLLIAIQAHRNQIVAAHAAATLPSVRAKYEWLARYHDDAIRCGFPNHPPSALIGVLPDPGV